MAEDRSKKGQLTFVRSKKEGLSSRTAAFLLLASYYLLLASDYDRRNLRLFASTDTEENDMAAAAIMGLSCQPVQG
jgi:hypothetical protein